MDLKTELNCEAIRDIEEKLCDLMEEATTLMESGIIKDKIYCAKMAMVMQAGTDHLSYVQLLSEVARQSIA